MRRTRLPFDMFDAPGLADEARRAQKLGSLYHRGQELAWDGRAVLADLVAKHGGVHIAGDQRAALATIFGTIMWGELAAWKISLQLADEIAALEPKMAATSQAHDEARHFYVMHDYLALLGGPAGLGPAGGEAKRSPLTGAAPRSMDRASRVVLDLVLETPSLVKKLLGMQLMVESLALTIFQVVREAGVEPVLADLLRYYEKDEARHVGLGVQLLPQVIRGLSRRDALGLFLFQLRLTGWTLAGLKSMEPALRTLGIDPRAILRVGRAKQTLAFQEMAKELGVTGPPRAREAIIRVVKGVAEALFSEEPGARARAREFVRGFRTSLDADLPPTALSPDDAPRTVRIVPRGRTTPPRA